MTDYVVYRDDGTGGAVETVVECGRGGAATVTACSVSGLAGGHEYVFAVSALSVAGEDDRS